MTVLALPAPSAETAPSVRTIARQQGIGLGTLIRILSLRRPDQSATERQFVKDFVLTVPGMQEDAFGNCYIVVGDKPSVLWSCHTDTVSKDGGNQNLRWNGDVLGLNNGKPGQSLGADDGAGLWLLLEMIKAEKPGLYVFHRAEEVGGRGSDFISEKTPELLDGIQIAVAFDRRGTDSIITHQRGGRCCSETFGDAFADMLNDVEPLFKYECDPTGSFTDTANYIDIVPECTNVSVGYYNEHGPRETLDVAHLLRLRAALLAIDVTTLPVKRDPSVRDYGYSYSYGQYGGGHYSNVLTWPTTIEQIVKTRPMALSKWFENMGVDVDQLNAELDKVWNYKPAPANKVEDEEDIYEGLYCNDCETTVAADYTRFGAYDGAACDECGSNNTASVRIDGMSGEPVW